MNEMFQLKGCPKCQPVYDCGLNSTGPMVRIVKCEEHR